MKVTQVKPKPPFTPVVITLETEGELARLVDLLGKSTEGGYVQTLYDLLEDIL